MTNHKLRSPSRRTAAREQLSVVTYQNHSPELAVASCVPLPATNPALPFDEAIEGAHAVLESIAPNANQELAALLRDVYTEAAGTSAGGGQHKTWQGLLKRAVRCATQQYSLQAELEKFALTDELTQLYNRRGFLLLAERQLKLARRTRRGLLLFFMDLDGLKQINDTLGHAEGDRALRETAWALKKTFRESDVLARFGGDEFAALAIEASDFSEKTIRNRLGKNLRAATVQSGYPILLSLGAARFNPRTNMTLQELLAKADHAMYCVKRGESRTRSVSRAASN